MATVESERRHDGALVSPALPVQRRRGSRSLATWQRLVFATDASAIGLAIVLLAIVTGGSVAAVGWIACCGLLAITFMWSRGLYRSWLDLSILDTTRAVVAAVAVAGAFTLTARVTLSGSSASRETIVGALSVMVLLAAGRSWRIVADRRNRTVEGAGERTLIVGAGNIGRLVARRLREHPDVGLRPVGLLDKDPLDSGADPELPVLGASWDLEQVVREWKIEHVVVAFSTAPDDVLLELLKRCERLGLRTSVVPRFFDKWTEHATVVPLGAVSLVASHVPHPKSWEFGVKHALDRVGAAVAIVLLAPFFVLASIGVWVSLGRPILYRAERVGRDGKRFDMLKFRSMLPMTNEEQTKLIIDPEIGTGGNNGVDRRTAFGAFIRRTSLDELPQLLNVFRGDMSLVGPRPERSEYVESYEQTVPRYRERHRVKSGITGWAQVCGLRGKTSLVDRAEWDNYYIENWSFWLDLKILMLTFVAVFRTGEAD